MDQKQLRFNRNDMDHNYRRYSGYSDSYDDDFERDQALIRGRDYYLEPDDDLERDYYMDRDYEWDTGLDRERNYYSGGGPRGSRFARGGMAPPFYDDSGKGRDRYSRTRESRHAIERDYNLGTGTSMRPRESMRNWDQNDSYGRRDRVENSAQYNRPVKEGQGWLGIDVNDRYFDLEGSQKKNFSGKGPKGWRRSDERIREEVCEALHENHAVDALEIDVTVNEGVVCLQGRVDDRNTKRMAERCVEDIRGVADVQNELQVTKNEDITEIPRSRDSDRTASLY